MLNSLISCEAARTTSSHIFTFYKSSAIPPLRIKWQCVQSGSTTHHEGASIEHFYLDLNKKKIGFKPTSKNIERGVYK